MININRTQHVQWESLFELSDQIAIPLQRRLRLSVVNAILDGRLPLGAPLPSSRELAKVLGVGRNTVTAAYEQLADEGFIESRPRSGVFVTKNARTLEAREPDSMTGIYGQSNFPPDWSSRVLRSMSSARTLSKPDEWRSYPFPFIYGTYDPQLFPTEALRECCSQSLARSHLSHWTPDLEVDDVPELIEQIRLRLLPKRGVFALKEDVLVTLGAQHAYYLLAEALFDERTIVGLEEPGHPHARNSFSLRSPEFVQVAVDSEGVMVDGLPSVDYLFVTPSHQSPTTVTMSLERRQRLLQKAELEDFVLIEDDYEAENLYEGSPLPALKSLDKTGRVIYVGSVSKSLSPSLRLGFIVAPRALISELRVLRHAMLRHPSAFLQHAYALFLLKGHQDVHSRRVNQAMQERLTLVSKALVQYLPDFKFTLPSGGASVWVRAPAWVDSGELELIARSHGVLIEGGDAFFAKPPYPCPFFRLRLSSIPSEKISDGIKALGAAVKDLAFARGVVRT
jgi:GntR family transcriptional regulator/MocR family aminotransferase